jgi:hypothetical protein
MKEIRRCLTEFDFRELFIQHLLWEGYRAKHAFEVGGQFFEVEGVAEKRGLVVFTCTPAPNQPFPGSAERKRIGREVEKLHHEHLIIFIDREQTRQIWSVPKREDGKSKGTSEIPFYQGKGVEHLARRIQKISFSLEESETTTIVQVAARVNQALLAERVTKKFFKEFSDQRKAFVKFLDWIEDESKRDWYCSVLLNRLMFIYFLGGKGFLPGGTGFLSNNLENNKSQNGADTFYTHFLLPLSFFGLGEKKGKRERFEDLFKDVIYLNGGLFAVHSVERELGIDKAAVLAAKFDAKTKIPDSEFQKWFDYFDKWRWTLDEDKVENDGYISPHILGYIFEKYINQKQMGAYYTKEDITGYICRNTIIPRLFDMLAETGEKGKKAVRPLPVGPHPNLLNEGRGISDGEGIDRYVYSCVKQESKLPTETDYEQEQRRKRYEAILEDFDAEKIQGIDDFITYNLDIERIALDFISNIQDPEVLHNFYSKGLQQITVLDPTCGSGAFLFEALVIMYPLYNACLSRMRYLVGKGTGTEPEIVNWGGRLHFDDLDIDQSTFADMIPTGGGSSEVLEDLRTEVERINDHPSAEYFIKKSIIVNNLFGVDIMEEAVEICKLRLFLTLIATVERDDSKDNFGVEPLPDIDFNILAGNSLVGYTSIADIDRLWHEVEIGSSTLAFEKDHSRLKSLVGEYRKVLRAWRQQQLGEWSGTYISKEQVLKAAESVRPDLDEDVWRLYRTGNLVADRLSEAGFKTSHEPLHWMLEFPTIEAAGGFQVIIGNPPYVEISPAEVPYSIPSNLTLGTGNLYTPCFVRSLQLLGSVGRFGLIVPMSITSIREYSPLMEAFTTTLNRTWVTNHAIRPQALFDGISQRVSICMGTRLDDATNRSYSTRYIRTDAPANLFRGGLEFSARSEWSIDGIRPKLSSDVEHAILANIREFKPYARFGMGDATIWLKDYGETYWIFPTSFQPFRTTLKSYKTVAVSKDDQLLLVGFLNSSLFYWLYHAISDCWHLGKWHLRNAPIGLERMSAENKLMLVEATEELMNRMVSTRVERYDKRANGTIFEYRLQQCKASIDKIDAILASHFGLDESQLNFIQKYDFRFRMGLNGEEVDD